MTDELPHRKALAASRSGPPKVQSLSTGDGMVAAAQDVWEDALMALHQIAVSGMSETARIAAANSILDRGFGKPGQSVTVYDGAKQMRGAWDAVEREVLDVESEEVE